MQKRRFIVEMGTGIDLHGENATEAACRAVKDAISKSCLCGLIEILQLKDLGNVDVEILIASPRPQEVDLTQVMATVPIGRKTAKSVDGGMTVQGINVARFAPDCDQIIVANAAVTVSISD
jgi:uncharacterized protein (TIGR02058 family)